MKVDDVDKGFDFLFEMKFCAGNVWITVVLLKCQC